jgi:hypothetical protein
MNDKIQLVFIGGPPRAGTTLLQRILSGHPSIYAGPEFDFVPAIVSLRNNMRSKVRVGRIDFMLSEEDIDRHFSRMLIDMLSEKARKEGVSMISEKSPANASVIDAILELLPCARGIVVLRDPRAIVSSMKDVGARFVAQGRQPPLFCRDVKHAVDRINAVVAPLTNAAQKFPDRFMIIYYEDLVTSPLNTIHTVCDFLHIKRED